MTPPWTRWWRWWRGRSQPAPHPAGDRDLAEAAHAGESARIALERLESKGPDIRDLSAWLRAARNQNNFSLRVARMVQEGQRPDGGSHL